MATFNCDDLICNPCIHQQDPLSCQFIPFTKQQILHKIKLKAFADDNLNVVQMIKFVFERVKSIVRKAEKTDNQYLSFSDYVFIRLLS